MTPDVTITSRLRLKPASVEQLRAILAGDYDGADELLGCRIPEGWPEDVETREGLSWHLAAIENDPGERLWRIRFVIEIASNTLVGAINLKGPPDASGDAEIGWGIVPSARRRGFATEAAMAVIDWAFGSSGVTRVSATVPKTNVASQRVAERLGMERTGETRRGLPLWAITRARARAARP